MASESHQPATQQRQVHRITAACRGIFPETPAGGGGRNDQRLRSQRRTVVARRRAATNDLRDDEGWLDDWKSCAVLCQADEVRRLRHVRGSRDPRCFGAGRSARVAECPPAEARAHSGRNHQNGIAHPLRGQKYSTIRHGSHPAGRHCEAATVRLRDLPRFS